MHIWSCLFKLNIKVDLNSISMSKNEPMLTTITKYDVEAAIDEIENAEEESVFKYDFTVLSDPKNVRLAINGITRIHGDSIERDEILDKDENDVPKILTVIYQELFPTFFLLSKTLNVSCPPHTIGAMGNGISETEEIQESTGDSVELPEEVLESPVDETVETIPSDENPDSETIETPDIAQP